MNPIINQGIDYGVGTAARQIIGSRIPFLPDFYNSRAGDIGGGFRNSQFSHMLQGNGDAWRDYGLKTLGGIGGGMLGGPLGALIGSKFLPWIGDRLFGGPTMPQFSNYGPYASGYKGLPGTPLFGAGHNPGDLGFGPTMPEFFGEGPNYIMPEEAAPANYVQIKNPAKPSWQSMGRDDKAHSGWSGVMGKGANGEALIRGVQFFGGLGGGMGAEGQKAYKKRDPSE